MYLFRNPLQLSLPDVFPRHGKHGSGQFRRLCRLLYLEASLWLAGLIFAILTAA